MCTLFVAQVKSSFDVLHRNRNVRTFFFSVKKLLHHRKRNSVKVKVGMVYSRTDNSHDKFDSENRLSTFMSFDFARLNDKKNPKLILMTLYFHFRRQHSQNSL